MLNFFIAQSVAQSVVQSVESAVQSADSVPVDAAQNFSQSLKIMGLGVLGIFLIIGIIILLTWLLKKLFPAKEQ